MTIILHIVIINVRSLEMREVDVIRLIMELEETESPRKKKELILLNKNIFRKAPLFEKMLDLFEKKIIKKYDQGVKAFKLKTGTDDTDKNKNYKYPTFTWKKFGICDTCSNLIKTPHFFHRIGENIFNYCADENCFPEGISEHMLENQDFIKYYNFCNKNKDILK